MIVDVEILADYFEFLEGWLEAVPGLQAYLLKIGGFEIVDKHHIMSDFGEVAERSKATLC